MLDQVFANGIAYLRYVIYHQLGEGVSAEVEDTFALDGINIFLRPCFPPFLLLVSFVVKSFMAEKVSLRTRF